MADFGTGVVPEGVGGLRQGTVWRSRASAQVLSAVCSRIAYSDQKRPWCSYLLPAGEGAPQGRMRAELLALARKSPHPAVPATFSPREKERRPRRACNSTVKRANSRGKMPSLCRGGLPGSFNLPKEL